MITPPRVSCGWWVQLTFRHFFVNEWHTQFNGTTHDGVIKWKHFPCYWPSLREIHQSPVNYHHKGQWRGALMFSLIWAWTNGYVNNRNANDLKCRHRAHYDATVMRMIIPCDTTTFKSRHNGVWTYKWCVITSRFSNDTIKPAKHTEVSPSHRKPDILPKGCFLLVS